jgi:hypothetical protein
MGEVFKGWRRKTGCVTLLIACVLMIGWIRSSGRFDWACINGSHSRYGLASLEGRLLVHRSDVPSFYPTPLSDSSFVSWDSTDLSRIIKPFDPMTYADGSATGQGVVGADGTGFGFSNWTETKADNHWRFDWAGFHVGIAAVQNGKGTSGCYTCMFPYWSIVIPLTVLSAFLLFSKPRNSNHRKNAEPVAAEEK